MSRTNITLQCQECGHTTNRPAYCPYTGHRHSEGWSYKCSICRGEMKEVSYREGGACAFMVPEPGEPWITVKNYQEQSKKVPEMTIDLAAMEEKAVEFFKAGTVTGRILADEPNPVKFREPNFIQLNRNRLMAGPRMCDIEYTTAELDFVYAVQVKKYTGDKQWETRATAKREGLARLLFEMMIKFKGYGEEVRLRKIDPFTSGKVETIDES